MSSPFSEIYFSWALPLISSGWSLVTFAIPPSPNDVVIPYVTGNLEGIMSTLSSLVEGSRNPGPNMLPLRIVFPPSSLGPRYGAY